MTFRLNGINEIESVPTDLCKGLIPAKKSASLNFISSFLQSEVQKPLYNSTLNHKNSDLFALGFLFKFNS